MTRIRVYIATTEGPVAVQKITAEDPDVPSVACRDGTTEVLAISRDYTRFVDRGTGLVAALTGHGAYRLDLDRPVDGGRSWQLPVLLAHLIESEGRLAGPDEPADLVLLATGEVDRERRVRPVGRMREKLSAAGDLIARHGEDGPPLSVLLPAADRTPEIDERFPGGEDTSAGTVRLVAWERVGSLAELEPEPEGATASSHAMKDDSAGTQEDRGEETVKRGQGAAAHARHRDRDSRERELPARGGPTVHGDSSGRDARALRDAAGAHRPDRGGDSVSGAPAEVEVSSHQPAATSVAAAGDSPPVPDGKAVSPGTGHEALVGDSPAHAPAAGGSEAAPRRRLRAVRMVVVLLLLLAAAGLGAGAAWWNGPRHWEALRRAGDYEGLERALHEASVPPLADRYRSRLLAAAPPPESLVFSLVERRTPDGQSCSPQNFRGMNRTGRADPVETAVAPRKEGFFRSERGANLCRVVYRVANRGEQLVYLYFAVRPVLSVAADGPDVAPLRRGAALPSGASLTLDLELDRNPYHLLGADLLVLAAPSPSPQIRRTFEIATDGSGASGDWTTRSLDLTDLPALGLTVKGASHAILR